MSFLGFTSTRLGSEVSCPRTLPRKNPEDPVRLEPRTAGLRVKHFTTEPRGTLQDFRTGGHWFNPRTLPIFFPMKDCDWIHSSLTAVHCFDKVLCGKAAGGLGKILCRVLEKRIPGKHGQVHWLC